MRSAWVFDLDGTLVDSFSHYFAFLSDVFGSHGRTFSADLRVRALTEPMPQFFEEHLGKEAVAPALSSLQSQSNEDALRIRPFTGLETLVRQLSSQGDKIGVWTNRDLVSAQLILKHSGLEPYVTVCVSGSCVSQRKPHPEGLSRVMDHLGIRPEAVTMIGDHEHDVMAAKAAGVRAVRASWHGYWQVENCVHSDHQFHSVQEFSTWVERESRC